MAARSFSWSFESPDALADLAADWNALNAAGNNVPILDARFFELLLSEFSSGKERLAVGRDGDSIVSAGLIIPRRAGVWQTFQPSQAPIGPWLQKPGISTKLLLSSLLDALPGISLAVGLTQIDPWFLPRPGTHGALRSIDYIQTASVPVIGRFADYWSQRGRNLRQNLKRQRSRLSRESVDTRLRTVNSAEVAGEAVNAFGRLESSGWKAEQGTAVHPDNCQGRFYRKLMEDYCGRSEGLIVEYYYNDQLVASDICLHRQGVIYILKTTHDETQTGTSPAMLMRQEAFEQVFNQGGFTRIEFYGRLMDWHTKWTDDIRQMYHLTYYRWPFLASLADRKSASSIR
ncbi:MAG: GNAT family N-acetyltransferase [Methylococcaceae bacterium]|nr:GNAT family N-acetyltransferase [Methylococcaceae bacterium]